MRWRVQLGINSTSDVWKFCQNWTNRRGESNLANFQTSRVLLIPNCTTSHDYLFIISMTKLDTSPSRSYSLAKALSCQISTKIWYFCSYFHLVLLLKQNLVLLFVFSSSSSRAISFHICVQNTFPPFCLFWENH
jgi:hypothetical protein